jgi:hypothetical protein
MEDRRSDTWREERREQIAAALARQRATAEQGEQPTPKTGWAWLADPTARAAARDLWVKYPMTVSQEYIDSLPDHELRAEITAARQKQTRQLEQSKRRAKAALRAENVKGYLIGLAFLPVLGLIVLALLGVLGVGARVLVGLARLAGG